VSCLKVTVIRFNSSSFVNNGKYRTFVDLVILNPTITVIMMTKFNAIITAYLVPYIREGYDNKKIAIE